MKKLKSQGGQVLVLVAVGLVALIGISDLLCRMSGLNHGYSEAREINFLEETGFAVLSQAIRRCPYKLVVRGLEQQAGKPFGPR